MPPYLLVVESDPHLQRRIGDTLREARYELAHEAEGNWAKRTLMVRPPDGVILDTQLTDGSGFAVADALRSDPDTAKVPIFFVASRFRGAAHQAEARRRFAPAEYLCTPLDLDCLLALVLEVIPPSDPNVRNAVPDYPAVGRITDVAQERESRDVEHSARELASASAGASGTLETEPFARILQRIYTQRQTGALLLQRKGVKKVVYFAEGYPVSVRSNALEECLGQILLGHRMITRETLDESLRRMRAEGKHQGQVLIEMGALSPFNLQRALLAQMEAKVLEIFSWREGVFAFKEGKAAPGEPVRLDKPPATLILEGIRRHYDQERVHNVLEPYAGNFVAPSQNSLRRLQNITTDATERRFIDSIDGSQKLESLLAAQSIDMHRARLLLVAMSEAGMIEPLPARREITKVTRMQLEASDITGHRAVDAKTREELVAMWETMCVQTHYELLGVTMDATLGAVDQAYEALAREFHPDSFRFHPAEERALAVKIFDRLGQAQSVMRDPERRRNYLEQAERDRSAPRDIGSGLLFIKRSPPVAAEQVYFAGVEHLRGRRYQEAVQAFRHASTLAPDQASYRGALGWALYRTAPADPKSRAAALLELQRAVDMEPNNPWVRTSLGRFYSETGRPDDAVIELETALRLNPGEGEIGEEIRRLKGQT